MEGKKRKGSLFGLLARNYILFTVTLIVMTICFYMFWNLQISMIYQGVDWDNLITDSMLEKGKYEKLKRYMRRDGDAFAVLSETGEILYRSEEQFDIQLTKEELFYVMEYGSLDYAVITQYIDENGKKLLFVTKYVYDENTLAEEISQVGLDEEYRVVSGGLGDGRISYTQREIGLLTQTFSAEYTLHKYHFTDIEGCERLLLVKENTFNEEKAQQEYDSIQRIWLIVIPLYIVILTVFIWRLNYKIRMPLEKLNRAIIAQTRGEFVHVGDCGGTSEIQRIGESFDQLTLRLSVSEQERKRLDEGRQKMIADISHDLKTPITVIAGYAKAICDGKVSDEKAKRYLRLIQEKAEYLSGLINRFHEYSKMVHPSFTLHLKKMDICESLRGYLAKKYDEIEFAGFSLEIQIPEYQIMCELDEIQFVRILDNITSNAIRYNRMGTVLFFEILEEKEVAKISIADNGVGISKEYYNNIFEPFIVGNEARNDSGSGLGLAITKQLVSMHGGNIELLKTPRNGYSTEFWISIPKCQK